MIKLTKEQKIAVRKLIVNYWENGMLHECIQCDEGTYYLEGFKIEYQKGNAYLANITEDETDEQLAKRFSTWLLMKKLTI